MKDEQAQDNYVVEFTRGEYIDLSYTKRFNNNLKLAKSYDTLYGGTIATAKTWIEENTGTET